MQQLLGQLAANNYVEWHRCDDCNWFVWAHPVSLDLSYVLIMDCTYKTNRYHLPLLEIVGVTSTDLTLSTAFTYLQFEQANNYTWPLDILRILMDESALPLVIVTYRESLF